MNTVQSQFIPKASDLTAAMDEFVETTSYDEPSASIEDPDPIPEDDAGEGVSDEQSKPAKKIDSTIIQL